jgi:hypothetical protein
MYSKYYSMKKILIPTFVLCSFLGFSQTSISVEEKTVAIDGVSRNSLTVTIPGANTDDVKKAWKKQLKDLKGKVSDKTIIFGDDCKTKEMGDNSFDVYSVVEEANEAGVRLVVAFDLGGAYLSTANHPDKYPAGEKIVYDFSVEQTKEVVRGEIGAAEKSLSMFEKELAGLEKDKAGYEKDIVDYEKKIEEAKLAIQKTVTSQGVKQKEIDGMKAVLKDLDGKLKSVK